MNLNKCLAVVSRNRKSRRGSLMVLAAFMLVILLGTCAFVADLGNIIVVRSTMDAAADAAALAGAGAMAQYYTLDNAKQLALDYAQTNVPPGYGTVINNTDVTFGVWEPNTRSFTPNDAAPNAIRVTVQRAQARDNAVPYFFGRIFGNDHAEITAEAIAVGAVGTASIAYDYSVYVTSSKDLSNVVLEFADGEHQKFEPLNGYSGTFQGTGEHEGKEIVGVWIKSGCNSSGDGPGYGECVANPGDSTTVHGQPKAGCTPHVTATFEATGVEFTESGSSSPIRLVQ